jgi:hypothetical protein
MLVPVFEEYVAFHGIDKLKKLSKNNDVLQPIFQALSVCKNAKSASGDHVLDDNDISNNNMIPTGRTIAR